MADNLTLTIGADASQLRAQLAVAQSELRATTREMTGLANAARKTGDDLKLAQLGQVAANYNKVSGEVAALRGKLQVAADEALNFGMVARHGIAIFDESMRDARGAMISSVSALVRDSGIAKKAIEALSSPWAGIGIAATASAAIVVAGLASIVAEAIRTTKTLNDVWNAAGAAGRNAAGAVANTAGMASSIQRGGTYGKSDATQLAAAIESIQSLTEADKAGLAGVTEAITRYQFGGDLKKAAEDLPKLFESLTSMKEAVEKQNLLGGSQLYDFAQAYANKDTQAAASLVAGGLRARYLPSQQALGEATTNQSVFGIPGYASDIAPPVISPRYTPPAILPALGQSQQLESIIKDVEAQLKTAGGTGEGGNEAAAFDFTRGVKAAQEAANKIYEDFAAAEKLKLAEAQNNQAKITAVYREWEAKAAEIYGQDSRQYLEIKTEEVRAAQEAGRRSATAAREAATQAYEAFSATERLKIAEAQGDADKIAAIYTDWARQAAAIYGADSRQFAEAETEKLRAAHEAAQKYAEEWKQALEGMIEEQNKAKEEAKKTATEIAKNWSEPFTQAIDKITSTWENGLKSLLTARNARERANAWHQIYQGEVGAGIDFGTSILSKGTASLVSGGASQGKGLGEYASGLVGNWVGKQFGSLTNPQSTTQTALQTQANASLTALTALQTTANGVLAAIAASDATIAAAVTSSAATGPVGSVAGGGLSGILSGIPILGSLFGGSGAAAAGGAAADASGAAAAVLAASRGMIVPRFSLGGILPAAAGGWALPSSFGADRVLSALKPGEMVLPTHISQGIQSAMPAAASAVKATSSTCTSGRGDVLERWRFSPMAERKWRRPDDQRRDQRGAEPRQCQRRQALLIFKAEVRPCP